MKPMLCTIYRGSRENELYLYVAKGHDLSQLPTELMTRIGEVKEVMTLALDINRKLARVKTENVLADIKEKGYFLQLPPNIDPAVFTYGE
ncbi:YcgL domain-containing protein [Gammaproteobacteria bacterium]|nr:YcgL domain-containing protein [Gammaproteobacteria bacterium]